MSPVIRQGPAVTGLGQGRVTREQGAFTAIDAGEKPLLEVLDRVTAGGVSLVNGGVPGGGLDLGGDRPGPFRLSQ